MAVCGYAQLRILEKENEKMKKFIAMLLVLSMVLAFAGCTGEKPVETQAPTAAPTAAPTEAPTEAATEVPTGPAEAEAPVMSHADYVAAELDSPVCVETYVQATQSWWDNKITVYAQSEDGAYFIYEMECSEENAAKLVPGTKIRVNGFKGEWSGEVEIMDATFELLEGTYTAEPFDATALWGTDELINHQNEKVTFKGLTVEKVEYKNNEPGDDIYVTLSLNGTSYQFVVEMYLTGPDTDLYKAVGELKEGNVVDIEGFLYWYEGPNTHITAVSVVG